MRKVKGGLLLSSVGVMLGLCPLQTMAQGQHTAGKAFGGVNVACYPDGASIHFNGKDYTTNFVADSLVAGKYPCVISKVGYVSIDTTLVVREGVTGFYNVFMRKGASPKTKTVATTRPVVQPKVTKEKKAKEPAPSYASKTKVLAMAQMGYAGSGDLAYGLMLGVVKDNGFYVKGLASFSTETVQFEREGAGLNDFTFAEGDTDKQSLYFSGGYLRKLCKPLLMYVGAGYGKHDEIWTTTEGYKVKNKDLTDEGVLFEGGLVLRAGAFAVSAGVQTLKFKTCALQVGLGVTL